MLSSHAQPIVAIATAQGRGAVGIVRVSGFGLAPLIQAVCGRDLRPREATYLPFLDTHGQAIDRGLALYFPAPHSYTGEEVLELQAHGGPVVMQLILARCLEAGAALDLRMAQPGEFTQRAFLNDKMDLAQAEAVADLIDASTQVAARSAARAASGEFSQRIHSLSEALKRLRLAVEASLDFPEEEDVDMLQQADAKGQLDRLEQAVQTLLDSAQQGMLLREGIKVVLVGQPNVGKSSLLNALAGEELAIVTPIAGTTRDALSQAIQIEGVPLHILDMAGLRESVDEVEKIGIARAWSHIQSADVALFLHDLTRAQQADYVQADEAIERELPLGISRVDVWNKQDAMNAQPQPLCEIKGIAISAKTGEGLPALKQKLLALVGWRASTEGVFMARERHLKALRQAQEGLLKAQEHLSSPRRALDLLAEELRLVQQALSEMTGEYTPDDLLGDIFSKFCIGK